MKEKLKKYGLLSLIALLYLSNTGLIYTVHTCLHTGASVIEMPQLLSEEDDHCPPAEDDVSCKDNKESCCKAESEKQRSCHTHTTEYKKADIVSVKPEVKVSPILDYSASVDLFSFINFLLPQRNIDESHIHYYLSENKDSQARTSLQHRICLSSFIC